MADRWMDERDREWRERDWRRAEEQGRGGDRRRYEDRTWTGSADDERGRYSDVERDYGADERDPGGADLTTGGAYGRDPLGSRGRFASQAPRFSTQDYTGRSGGYQGGQGSGPRWRDDYERQDYARPDYDPSDYRERQASGPGRDWQSEREAGWARYSPERGHWDDDRDRRDYRRDERRDGSGDFLTKAGERISSWFRGSDLMQGSRSEDNGEPRRYREDFGREARAIPESGHRGRGPRGYRRSDERISDEVHDRLTDDPWLDASNIDVQVKDAEVTLTGSVDNREAKHRAERLVEDISGVTHVQNNLRVNPDARLTGAGRGLGSSALEAEMRRNAHETDPSNNGVSGLSGRTSTGALSERSAGSKNDISKDS